MLSLSNLTIMSMNALASESNVFLAVPKKSGTFLPLSGSLMSSGLISKNPQQTSIVSRTPAGGFPSDFTSSMSLFLSESSAFSEAASAGSALSRSACAESAISLVAAAFSFASASWTWHAALVTSASALSAVMTTIISLTSLDLTTSTGASASISFCSVATTSFVELSLSKPTCSRSRFVFTCANFMPSKLLKLDSSSRYEVGVT